MVNCCDKSRTPPAQSAATSACCGTTPPTAVGDQCCPDKTGRIDYLLYFGLISVLTLYLLHLFAPGLGAYLGKMAHTVFELMNTMWWGLAAGIIMVASLSRIPREFVLAVLGDQPGVRGLVRATLAGVLLDLCSHGILMVGAKLYERGASIGQVMAFLIASPWNSFSLTLILVAFIGLPWTLVFIGASVLVAIASGWLFDLCVARHVLPANPHRQSVRQDFKFWPEARSGLRSLQFSWSGLKRFVRDGVQESRVVLRWLLLGVVIAALIRTFVSEDLFAQYFGPTLIGLILTSLAATIIEVCSEGSTPIAADIFNRAAAPGNAFAFLMTGVSTDYTEIMVLRERTKSWKIALFLPLITMPQVLVLAVVMNLAA